MTERKRCAWCNMKNPLYIRYHDEEWGKLRLDDAYLFEMLLLESFQAGLSWECVLNKREAFRIAFDQFDIEKVREYDAEKIDSLMQNPGIIRNRKKLDAAVTNASVFTSIIQEYGSFQQYLRTFWDGVPIHDYVSTTTLMSDSISKDLRKRGMKFVGSTTIQAYLQAVGIYNAHSPDCYYFGK